MGLPLIGRSLTIVAAARALSVLINVDRVRVHFGGAFFARFFNEPKNQTALASFLSWWWARRTILPHPPCDSNLLSSSTMMTSCAVIVIIELYWSIPLPHHCALVPPTRPTTYGMASRE
jgi:hypothetical protein